MNCKVIVAVLVVATAGYASGTRLNKLGLLKCSACRVLANEILEKRRELLESEKQPVQVSHRLGNGKWDPHGDGGVKKVGYANSELMAIETTEGLCTGISGYKLRYDENGDRTFSKNAKLKEAEGYNKLDSDCAKKPNKMIEQACVEFMDEFDEEIHAIIRNSEIDDETFVKKICEETIETCRNLEYERKKEAANKAAYEERKVKRWERARQDGTGKTYQIAEFHFSMEGVEIDLTDVTATSESGEHPKGEGPENLIDKDPNTKCLDNARKSLLFNFANASAIIDAFTFTTANDFPDRDPVRWHLQISEESSGNTTWVNITSTIEPPFATPIERGVKLPWFTFDSVNVTGKILRFEPVFGGAKKVKKEKKKPKEELPPKKTKLSDLQPGRSTKDYLNDPTIPHFELSTHDEDGNPNALFEHVKKISKVLTDEELNVPDNVKDMEALEKEDEEL
eukprot:TRINITY_DN9978_c0_g1_i1.p1 TRINITY_DN9978_c0_g1~~TRINITY_DN9978_c0_g1_i1.p1  ORF type:complete len:453 (+),score=123.15 TRINITY_DN9978_c0_g1_i1:88-1446(+)